MVVAVVSVYVLPEYIGEFLEITLENHRGARSEPGNRRFDVLRSRSDPSRFTLYEVYESDEAAAEHKKTPHYLKWRDTVEKMMAKPREGLVCDVLAGDF